MKIKLQRNAIEILSQSSQGNQEGEPVIIQKPLGKESNWLFLA